MLSEEFRTVRGLAFTYVVSGNQVIRDRTDYPLHQINFRGAHEGIRVPRARGHWGKTSWDRRTYGQYRTTTGSLVIANEAVAKHAVLAVRR